MNNLGDKELLAMRDGEKALEVRSFYLDYAEGNVDPAVRVANGEILQSDIDQLEKNILEDKYTVQIDKRLIPCMCMDCRFTVDGNGLIGSKSAGGTLTLVIADAFTYNTYQRQGDKLPEHKKRVYIDLQARGNQVGGHIATNTRNSNESGCGAKDKLDSEAENEPSIFRFVENNKDQIFNTMSTAGINVSSTLKEKIGNNVTKLRHEKYATPGAVTTEAGIEVAGKESYAALDGEQKGVLVAILTEPGEALNHDLIKEDFGDNYQVFELHLWAIKNGVDEMSVSPEEADDRFAAAVAYNLATAGVIVGPGMKFIVK